MEKKLAYVKYRPKGSNWCTEEVESFVSLFKFPDTLEILGEGVHEFKIVYMTDAEYEALPEFAGF
jgi:hypothetical protein